VDDRCEHCPVAPGKPCVKLCDWAASGDEVKRRHIVAVSDPESQFASVAVTTSPGLFARAVGFGKAIVTHTVAGFPEADEATYERRLSTCRACPHLDAEGFLCKVCGCRLEIKLKWRDQACPIGKW
jgi:hypothetical protein